MKNIPLFIFTIFALTGAAFAESQDKGIEPAQTFVLTINGVQHEIVAGHPYDLPVSGKSHEVLLTKSETRQFDYSGVSFEFNSALHFSYEALAPEVDHWSLDGNNAVIMVQKYSPKAKQNEIVDGIRYQFMEMNADIEQSEAKLDLGGKTETGRRLVVNLGEVKLEQQIYYFSDANSAVVVILQDTLTDSGANTTEFVDMRNLLEKTLVVNF